MKLFGIALMFTTSLISLAADDLIGWRMDGTGRFDAASPPTTFSGTENVVWKTAMPDWSNAQVIMVGDKLFTNSEPNTLIAVDRHTGKILWQKTSSYDDALGAEEVARMKEASEAEAAPIRAEIKELEAKVEEGWAAVQAAADDEEKSRLRGKMRGTRLKLREAKKKLNEVDPLNPPDKHKDNGYTSAIPVSDGEGVYAVFGNGVVSGFTLDGKRKWTKLLEKPSHFFGHSTSPVVSGDHVIYHVKDVVALNKDTGKEIWRVPSKEGWGSMTLVDVGGEPMVITATEGDVIRVKDGKKMAEKIGGLVYATPVIQDGVYYRIENKASAHKIPKSADDLNFESIWQSRIKGSRHYASSLIKDGLIYAVSREGWVSVLDEKTGELVYEHKLDMNGDNINSVYPSLSYAGGKVFIGFEEGFILVIEPGREFKEVARNTVEPFRGTPIFVGNNIYLRGHKYLYCLGSTKKETRGS